MTEQAVTYELDGEVALIGLNRPHKRNSISDSLREGLAPALARANDEAKVGVIFGHGDCFCGGLDLSEAVKWINADPEVRLRRRGTLHPILDSMARGYIPFVAALHGACIGGGARNRLRGAYPRR